MYRALAHPQPPPVEPKPILPQPHRKRAWQKSHTGKGLLTLNVDRWDEPIMIGDDIEVYVTRVRGKHVRLGFKAPKHVKILRKKLYDATVGKTAAA